MKNVQYIALLRAINVGGHTVKMDRLRALFSELGFTNVRTYIQSGNVFFESPEEDSATLASSIEKHLTTSLGYDVPTIIRTLTELQAIIKRDPFRNIPLTEETRHYILFLNKPLPLNMHVPIQSPKGDFTLIATTSQDIFLILTLINGRPGNPTTFVEKLCGAQATSRFYHTTVKLLEAATAPE